MFKLICIYKSVMTKAHVVCVNADLKWGQQRPGFVQLGV